MVQFSKKTLLFAVTIIIRCSIFISQAAKDDGDSCQCRYGTPEGFDDVFHYFEVPTSKGKCSDGGDLVCLTEDDTGDFVSDFPGTCRSAKCFAALNDNEGKVTICHRTCSENNPWVRITIDASAWVEHSCGHTIESCNGKDPTYWGDYQGDYILKIHGTRDQVADMYNDNAQEIRNYWKHWEPACPSVRNGNCCDFDGEYGYSCCGRANIDPSMPGGAGPNPSVSPVALPTLAPAPTFAPAALPTMAPITETLETLLPTFAPVSTPSDNDGAEEETFESPQCYNRRLQDIEERWSISIPEFRYERSLSFYLDFEISEYISSEDMISHMVLDSTCTNSYFGAGLLHTRGLRLPVSDRKQNVGVAMWVDPQEISQDEEIYSEAVVNNQVTANVDFCVRFGLHTPPSTPGGSIEVNYVEVIVSFTADLTDGFSIGTLSAAPYDRCEVEAQEAFEVEGYFCRDGLEATAITETPVINQGDQVKVCVRPVQRALDQGIRMSALKEFTWKLEGSGIEQAAIVDYAPAGNYLTNMYCQEGYAICHFESLLYATFFQTPGKVIGTGMADLQFGGESSIVSVSPKVRRKLNGNRRLQSVEPSEDPSVEFSLEATLEESTLNSRVSGCSPVSTNALHFFTLAVTLTLYVLFL